MLQAAAAAEKKRESDGAPGASARLLSRGALTLFGHVSLYRAKKAILILR